MPGGSTGGKDQPSNKGAGYGETTFLDSNFNVVNPAQIASGTESTSIAVRALPGNSDIVYLGFDSNVDDTTGFPLEAGDAFTFDLDADQQDLYVYASDTGDAVRWIALS